jgi:hypothetical protein
VLLLLATLLVIIIGFLHVMLISVVDPKLLILDPDPDPTLTLISEPDSDLDCS